MAETTPPAPARGPNCWQCQHFAVSWDPKRPYACLRMGFKSPVLPALEVLRVDGQVCRSFTPKENHAANRQNVGPAPRASRTEEANAMRQQTRAGLWLA